MKLKIQKFGGEKSDKSAKAIKTTKSKKPLKMEKPVKGDKLESPDNTNEYVETIKLQNVAFKDVEPLQFSLIVGSTSWTFTTTTVDQKKEWFVALNDTLDTFALHGLIDEMNENNYQKGFIVLNASYGWLKSDKHTTDVTSVIQEIIIQQGGGQLILNNGPKNSLFGNPTKHKHKQLLVIFSVNGAVKRKIFQENDPVSLSINS